MSRIGAWALDAVVDATPPNSKPTRSKLGSEEAGHEQARRLLVSTWHLCPDRGRSTCLARQNRVSCQTFGSG
ncbi:MAG: hypothetical protein NVSMB55_14720 [Mycobacteriales bacterium]